METLPHDSFKNSHTATRKRCKWVSVSMSALPLEAILTCQWTGVTSLDMSCSTGLLREDMGVICCALAHILPNLTELDLSCMKTSHGIRLATEFSRYCPHLTRITWNGTRNGTGICLYLNGVCFQKAANRAELSLDDCGLPF